MKIVSINVGLFLLNRALKGIRVSDHNLPLQETELQSDFQPGLDVAAWQAIFAFPPLMDSVPKPIIAAARAAVSSGRAARRLVGQRRSYSDDEDDTVDAVEDRLKLSLLDADLDA